MATIFTFTWGCSCLFWKTLFLLKDFHVFVLRPLLGSSLGPLCLCISHMIYVFLCLYMWMWICLYFTMSIFHYVYISLSIFHNVYMWMYLCISHMIGMSMCISHMIRMCIFTLIRVRVRNSLCDSWVHEYVGLGKFSWSAVFQDVVSGRHRAG